MKKLNNLNSTKEFIDKLNGYKSKNLYEVSIDEVENIDDICIDTAKSPEERVFNFYKEIKNPYFFNIDGTLVKFSYSDIEMDINDCIELYENLNS